MEELIEQLREAEQLVKNISNQISEYKDGYKYLTRQAVWQSYSNYIFNNSFSTGEYADYYNGDNDLIEVFTTNPEPNPKHLSRHEFQIVTEKQYQTLLKGKNGDKY